MFALVADVSSACARAPVERPDTVAGIVVVALAVVIGVTLGLSASVSYTHLTLPTILRV